MSDRLNILATVGSVAPFVGLFDRGHHARSPPSPTPTRLAVAPGIAEALFTAIGPFAAIPAVIAYNRLTHGLTASKRASAASPTAFTPL